MTNSAAIGYGGLKSHASHAPEWVDMQYTFKKRAVDVEKVFGSGLVSEHTERKYLKKTVRQLLEPLRQTNKQTTISNKNKILPPTSCNEPSPKYICPDGIAGKGKDYFANFI